jgi:endothelin-converting enzyme/putative endopeptidase
VVVAGGVAHVEVAAPWWSEADRAQFQARAACVHDQYAAFEVEPGLRLDGKRVESKAIGDLGGARIAYRALARSDPHPPGRFRVAGTLVNLPEFQQAFACNPGAKMVLPPEQRCAVW